MTLRSLLCASALSLFAASLVQADPITLTDIAGREVTIDAPVERVILGEGRQVFFPAVLDQENPFGRVVGWRDDFRQASPESYEIYADEGHPDLWWVQGRVFRCRTGRIARS